MKVLIDGEKLIFEGFPFQTKEIGISYLNSGVAIYNRRIDDSKEHHLNVEVKDGICENEKAVEMMRKYFKDVSSKTFIPTPDDTFICV